MKHLWIAIVAMVVMVGCGSAGEQTDGRVDDTALADSLQRVTLADGRTLLRLAYLPTAEADTLLSRAEGGCLELDSLVVELVPFTAHMDIDTALVGGSVDCALSERVRLDALREKHNVRTRVVAETTLGWTLVSHANARLTKLEQFGDKMVAMTRFSATDSLTDLAFAKVKVKQPYYKVQVNDVDLRLMMLLNNELDAAWLPEPQASRAIAEGHKALVSSADLKRQFGVLVAREDYARAHGPELEQLKALFEN